MLTRIRARITSAHLMAGAALFIALGGTAIAVQKNSVGTKQLKADAVSTKKLKDAAVTTRKLADNAATGAKVDESSLETVPNAASAAAAGTATNATNAASADSLSGRPLARVVSEVSSSQTTTPNGLPVALVPVLNTVATAAGAGPADIVAEAQLTFSGSDAGTATCDMQIDIGGGFATFGVPATASLPPGTTARTSMTLVAHFNNAPGGSPPIRVRCQKLDMATGVTLDSGSVVVTSTPE